MAKEKSGPRLMTLQAAAAESGVPYTSLRDLVIDGKLRRVRMGESRRIWIERKDLEQLIADSTVGAGVR